MILYLVIFEGLFVSPRFAILSLSSVSKSMFIFNPSAEVLPKRFYTNDPPSLYPIPFQLFTLPPLWLFLLVALLRLSSTFGVLNDSFGEGNLAFLGVIAAVELSSFPFILNGEVERTRDRFNSHPSLDSSSASLSSSSSSSSFSPCL